MDGQRTGRSNWAWLFEGPAHPWLLGPSATLTFVRGLPADEMFRAFGIDPAGVAPMTAGAALPELAAEGLDEGPFWLRVAPGAAWTVGIELAQKAYLDHLAAAASAGTEAVMVSVNFESFGVVQHFHDRRLVASFSVNDAPYDVMGPDPADLQAALAVAGLSPLPGPLPHREQLARTMDALTSALGLELSVDTYRSSLPTGAREHPYRARGPGGGSQQ